MTEIAAFFDLDRTLIRVNSASLWVKHLWEEGDLRKRDLVRSLGWMLGYKLALVDMRRVAREAVQNIAGKSEAEMSQRVRRWYESEIREHLIPEMIDMVDGHREAGHHLVLLTAGSPYIARLAARDVDLHDFLCTRFAVEDGVFTGELDGPMCYADGKVERSEEWAEESGVDLDCSYFYTDSYTDLPMLERVGHPVVVNPDPRLRRYARKNGLQIHEFETV